MGSQERYLALLVYLPPNTMNEYLRWLFEKKSLIQTLLAVAPSCPEYTELMMQLERANKHRRFDDFTYGMLKTFPVPLVEFHIQEEYKSVICCMKGSSNRWSSSDFDNQNSGNRYTLTYFDKEPVFYVEQVQYFIDGEFVNGQIIAYYEMDDSGFVECQAKALFKRGKTFLTVSTELVESFDTALLDLESLIPDLFSEHEVNWYSPSTLAL